MVIIVVLEMVFLHCCDHYLPVKCKKKVWIIRTNQSHYSYTVQHTLQRVDRLRQHGQTGR